jgi:hypothetical protein
VNKFKVLDEEAHDPYRQTSNISCHKRLTHYWMHYLHYEFASEFCSCQSLVSEGNKQTKLCGKQRGDEGPFNWKGASEAKCGLKSNEADTLHSCTGFPQYEEHIFC